MTQTDVVTHEFGNSEQEEDRAQNPGISVSAETYHWKIVSRPELVEPVVMQLKDRAEACGICPPERTTGLVISLTEAITNALVHGNLEISSEVRERTDGSYAHLLASRCANPQYAQREVHIDVHWNGTTCEWIISDAGHGFDVERLLRRLEADGAPDDQASGRGILLMKAFMDDVTWAAGGSEIRLVMAKNPQHDVPTEKWKQIRQAVKAKGFTAAPDDSVNLIATALSTSGMRLVGTGLENAKRLLIEVDYEGSHTLLPAEVRHITKLASDWVQIDCRFNLQDKPLTEKAASEGQAQRDAIDRMLSTHHHASDQGHERRESTRFQYTGVIRVQTASGVIYHAIARDLSRGGLAFIGNFNLQRNEKLVLTLESETAKPITVRCQVTRCQQLAGTYHDFGVKFLEG